MSSPDKNEAEEKPLEGEESLDMKTNDGGKAPSEGEKTKAKKNVILDPNDFVQSTSIEELPKFGGAGEDGEEGNDEVEDYDDQDAAIGEAFADDDVVDDFK